MGYAQVRYALAPLLPQLALAPPLAPPTLMPPLAPPSPLLSYDAYGGLLPVRDPARRSLPVLQPAPCVASQQCLPGAVCCNVHARARCPLGAGAWPVKLLCVIELTD